jgi:hypothetical protein
VHPGGSVLLVTRWHPNDLAGELLDSEPDIWRHTNIPAVAETGVPDALGRAPGVAMTSALGFHRRALRRHAPDLRRAGLVRALRWRARHARGRTGETRVA